MSQSLQDEYIKKESLFGAKNYAPLSVVLDRGKGFGMLMETNILTWYQHILQLVTGIHILN